MFETEISSIKKNLIDLIIQYSSSQDGLGTILDFTGGAADPEWVVTVDTKGQFRALSPLEERTTTNPADLPIYVLALLLEQPEDNSGFSDVTAILEEYCVNFSLTV
jgi:hypothetical protein